MSRSVALFCLGIACGNAIARVVYGPGGIADYVVIAACLVSSAMLMHDGMREQRSKPDHH